MSAGTKRPSEEVMEAARDVCRLLAPHCERLIIAGSLRRLKEEAGDAEILYIPKQGKEGLFLDVNVNLAERQIAAMLANGVLRKRASAADRTAWGPLNKLGVHAATGIGIDLFATTAENWWNALVVKTGPAALNEQISVLAKRMGWNFHAYGSGFSRGDEYVNMTSEQEVFDFVGLPYLQPWER